MPHSWMKAAINCYHYQNGCCHICAVLYT